MEENEILKPIYLSKKDIINNIPYLYTEKEDNTYYITKNLKNYSIPKKQKNLGRKNLTYQNFLDFTYDFNNITEHKLKMPDHLKIKQKYELMFNKGYSPFQPKKARKKIAPLLITGLNTTNNGKYSNIFSSSQKTFENSDIKTKSSSHKFNKSNYFNNNSSNKNDILYPSEISKSNIHFHKNIDKFTKNENKDEGLKAFVLKSRIILKEKIIKQELTDKLNYQNELHMEGINDLNQRKEQFLKSLKLFELYNKVYVHYLRELLDEEMKERSFYIALKQKKSELEYEINKLHKKIDLVKNELTNYESLKKFFKFSKSGLESLIKMENKENEIIKKENKENEIIKKENKENKENRNIKENTKPKIIIENKENEEKNNIEKNKIIPKAKIYDFRKNSLVEIDYKFLSHRNRIPNEKSLSPKKDNYFSRLNSLKQPQQKLESNKNDDNEKYLQIPKKKEILNKRKSRRKSSMLVHQKQYEHLFTNVENSILKNIEKADNQRNQIIKEKENLEEIKRYSQKENIYMNEMMEKKEKILSKLKEENYNLKTKYNLYSKTNFEEGISQKVLEQKMLEIILNINNKINVQEILNIKNLLFLLKLKSQDFLERFKKAKFIFLIKIIELIISYLISKKNKYLSEPKLKEEFKNFLYVLENDKKIRMNKLNKEMLQKELDNKKAKALDRATKVRFFSYRKFDLTPFRYRKNKTRKEKTSNKTTADQQYEQWILYD